MTPKLTIGMATYQDFNGVYFTVQALRMFHAAALRDCEILVIDNSPDSADGTMTREFLASLGGGESVRYIAAPEVVGTSAPRDRVFREARGQAVLCLDSHVLITPGALDSLLEYYAAHPDCRDLLSGPMLYDNLQQLSTHFADEWRAEMWGTWATDPRGLDPSGEPFEIPAMGLGLFTCRKDAWLGFNEKFRGFGGEEFYIHEKFRQAGAKCLCLPFLRWGHRFGRPAGTPYPITRWNKIRNYVLGHLELGLPLDRIKEHFVDGGLMPVSEWEQLIADPDRLLPDQPAGGCGCSAQQAATVKTLTLDEVYETAAKTPSDINEHCPKLRELAADAEHVTEFGMRVAVSTAALLAGQPKRLVSYAASIDPLAGTLTGLKGETDLEFRIGNSLTAEIEDTDLLFLDTRHTADQLYAELVRLAPKTRRRIALHDTQIFGETGEDGGPGLLPALRRYMQEHPEWSVIYHSQANHGFTVISRDPADKKQTPGLVKKAGNFAKALAAHIADGMKKVDLPILESRLDTCALCEQRTGDNCAVCGCNLPEKASWRSSFCPLLKWTAITDTISDTITGEPSRAA